MAVVMSTAHAPCSRAFMALLFVCTLAGFSFSGDTARAARLQQSSTEMETQLMRIQTSLPHRKAAGRVCSQHC